MAHHRRADEHNDGIRKRVGKACDRCRLKKTRCDGSYPCLRCKADNAICAFGERKKPNKIYPKGYVELLELQQSQLVSGLLNMYRQLQTVNAWTGPQLPEANGQPLTHDILAALNLLEAKTDGSGETEVFEDNFETLQKRLLDAGAAYVHYQESSPEPEADWKHSPKHSASPSVTTEHRRTASTHRHDSLNSSAPCTPAQSSPQLSQPRQHESSSMPTPAAALEWLYHNRRRHHLHETSSFGSSPLSHDPLLYEPEWAIPNMATSVPLQQIPQFYSPLYNVPAQDYDWQSNPYVSFPEQDYIDTTMLSALVGVSAVEMQSTASTLAPSAADVNALGMDFGRRMSVST